MPLPHTDPLAALHAHYGSDYLRTTLIPVHHHVHRFREAFFAAVVKVNIVAIVVFWIATAATWFKGYKQDAGWLFYCALGISLSTLGLAIQLADHEHGWLLFHHRFPRGAGLGLIGLPFLFWGIHKSRPLVSNPPHDPRTLMK